MLAGVMAKPELLEDLLSLPDAAQVLGLHRATVNNMVLCGRLKGYRLGPHWYLRRSEVELFRSGYDRPKTSPRRVAREVKAYWTNELLRWLLHWHDATSAELKTVVDLHIGNIRKYLALAEHDGLVTRDDCGRWALTIEGDARAQRLPAIEATAS
jgi:excisionase family DNA binding protein